MYVALNIGVENLFKTKVTLQLLYLFEYVMDRGERIAIFL